MPKIRPETLADGSKRYRFTINIGRHPVTNARQQRTYTFTRMKDARAELGLADRRGRQRHLHG